MVVFSSSLLRLQKVDHPLCLLCIPHHNHCKSFGGKWNFFRLWRFYCPSPLFFSFWVVHIFIIQQSDVLSVTVFTPQYSSAMFIIFIFLLSSSSLSGGSRMWVFHIFACIILLTGNSGCESLPPCLHHPYSCPRPFCFIFFSFFFASLSADTSLHWKHSCSLSPSSWSRGAPGRWSNGV